MPSSAWEPPWLVDILLQREALVALRGEGREPHDFAGLFVGDDDVRRALAGLPGLGEGPATSAALREHVAPSLQAARAELAATLRGAGLLAGLVRQARASAEEAEVLALLAGVECSPARQRLVCYVQDNVQPPRVTVSGLERIFTGDEGHPGALAVAPGSVLRRAGLVTLVGEGPVWTRACAVADRVIWHLAGDEHPDEQLPVDAVLAVAASPEPTASSAQLLLLHGADRESRRLVAARELGGPLLVTPDPFEQRAWEAVVREATLRGASVVVEVDELQATGRRVLGAATHLTFALSSPRELPVESLPARRWREVPVEEGDADETDWQRVLGRPPDPAHRLTREQLRLVGTVVPDAGGTQSTRDTRAADPLAPAVRRLAGGHLGGLALRVRPRRGWDDLVLSGDQSDQLYELVQRHRRRRRVYRDWGFPPVPSSGVVALFAGPSGTGKTLAAEVVAGTLGLDLYKVDLSSVVSKYIGETEKNLERIFQAASAVDLVLFLDEADALVGKRSPVGDAHDRYANIEVAYLLQRLESYDGLVVMASNLQGNIDHAFLRRISVSIAFTPPEVEQRRGIWACSFPATAPTDDLDLDLLAERFKVTGGIIHAAALGAAFLAADEDQPISTSHVIRSMRREYTKLGRLCGEDEFGPALSVVAGGDDVAPAR